MSYKQNILMEEMIGVHGAGYGTPLFLQKDEAPVIHHSLPSWIWNGHEVSQEALLKFENHLAAKEIDYLNAVLNLGGNATDNEVAEYKNWESGFVSARRNALMKVGIIVSYPDKFKIGPSGIKNTLWFVEFKKLFMLTLD